MLISSNPNIVYFLKRRETAPSVTVVGLVVMVGVEEITHIIQDVFQRV